VSNTLAIYGVVLGAAGCVASAASAVYFRAQARAAHRQSEVADRVALMESNLQMYSRFRETRNQFLQFPSLQREWRDTQPGFGEIFDASGGLDHFIAVPEAMDTMQDVHFLRKDGVVTDQYWHVWSNTFFRFYAKMPTFLRVFDFAAEEGLLHPDFVSFYRAAIADGTLKDPLAIG
jgi:hypothetical protein